MCGQGTEPLGWTLSVPFKGFHHATANASVVFLPAFSIIGHQKTMEIGMDNAWLTLMLMVKELSLNY